MESLSHHNLLDRRSMAKSRAPAVKWTRQWVTQDLVATGGKCQLLKWVSESQLKALREKERDPLVTDPEPEATMEVLFLCSFEGCGKTFVDACALRKHSHIHGERQYACSYEGCDKKFLDSSKLKRHYLIHTGERDFVCPHEGCGKAFSLDFNLRSHMKTHSHDNYHLCPYPECGKRYAHEYKLKNHVSSQHAKNPNFEIGKYAPPPEKVQRPQKTPAFASASSDRPYVCPYEGCDKAYIHEYKLKLHLRREHPGHMMEDNAENAPANADHDMDEASDHDGSSGKRGKSQKLRTSKPKAKMPPSKIARRRSTPPAAAGFAKKNQFPVKVNVSAYEDDSEETEEDRENAVDGWRYGENNEEDDAETDYED